MSMDEMTTLALDAGDGLTPRCLACLAPVEPAHYFEDLGRGRYIDVLTDDGTRRSFVCRECAASADLKGRFAALYESKELARRLIGGQA